MSKEINTIYQLVVNKVMEEAKQLLLSSGVSEEIIASLNKEWQKKIIDSNVFEEDNSEPQKNTNTGKNFTDNRLSQNPLNNSNSNEPTPLQFSFYLANNGSSPSNSHLSTTPQQTPFTPPNISTFAPYPTSNPSQTNYTPPNLPTLMDTYLRPNPLSSIFTNKEKEHNILPEINNGQITAINHLLPSSDYSQGSAGQLNSTNDKKREINPNKESQNNARKKQKNSINQIDGGSDSEEDFVEEDDEEEKKEEKAKDEDDLGSELDDKDENEEEPDTDNVIHCFYEKKKRVKSKWKVSLRAGIMHIEGKDYAFNTGAAEFIW